jgi:hypothetical protein
MYNISVQHYKSHNVSKVDHQGVQDRTKYGSFPTVTVKRTDQHISNKVAQKLYIPNLIQTLRYIYNLLWNLGFSRPGKLNDSRQFHFMIYAPANCELKEVEKCTKTRYDS